MPAHSASPVSISENDGCSHREIMACSLAMRSRGKNGKRCQTAQIPISIQAALCFFADDVPAARALEIGLCNRVVPQAELIPTARSGPNASPRALPAPTC